MTTLHITVDGIPGRYGYGGEALALDGYDATALVAIPQFSADELDPQSGEFTGSRCSIRLRADSVTRRRFLFQQTSAQAQLAVGLSDVDTTITLASPGISSSPEVLYLGAEAIAVAKVSDTEFSAARGQYGTSAASHLAGANVYTAPTHWRRRIVRVYSGTDQRWIGYLDKAPRSSSSASVIELVAMHALGLGDDLKVGDTRTAVEVAGQQFGARIDRTLMFTVNDDPTGQNVVAGSLLAIAPVRNADSLTPAYRYSGRGDVWDVPSIELIGSPEVDDQEARKVIPVLALGGDLAVASLVGPLHILEVAANLLFSDGSRPASYDPVGFTLFPSAWSARIGWATDAAAIAEIRALMAADPNATCDRLILGWDGNPVSVIPAVVQLLRLRGYVFGTTPSGALTFKRLVSPNVRSDITTIQPLRDVAQFESPEVGATDRVIATYGRTPWDPGATISTTIEASDPARGESTELDLAHLNVNRAGIEGTAYVLSMTLMRWRGAPILHVRASGCETIGLGDYVRLLKHQTLETPIFPTPDGDFTNDVNQEAFVGQIISRRWLPGEGAHELKVLLSAWPMRGLLRLRAPALVVESVSEPSVIDTIDDPGWGIPTDIGVEWPSYPIAVEAWTADGEVRTGVVGLGEAQYWAGGQLFMSGPFAVDPDPGDVIRVARGVYSLSTDPREYVIVDVPDRYE